MEIPGTWAMLGGAVSQDLTRMPGCLSVQISAVIASKQLGRVPVVHELLRSRWPPDGKQSERAVGAPAAHPEKSLSSEQTTSLFLARKRRGRTPIHRMTI
jgi:hypothetical protein